MIPPKEHYWLKNAHVPACLLTEENLSPQTQEGFVLVDLEIVAGMINQVIPASGNTLTIDSIDLGKKLIFPCFIDIHTHLDKGHIWQRSPNLQGTFENALISAKIDAQIYWQAEDIYRRMEFGLKCAYAHGTTAIRTHLDSFGKQAEINFNIFKTLKKEWQDKIILQAVSLVSLDYYQTPEGVILADRVADFDYILGGVVYMNPDVENQLDTVFSFAQERGINLDFHVDENGDPSSVCLQKVAEAALRNHYSGQIICGHCCSLAVQSPESVAKTLALVKEAEIGVVSLPMCNLYLQDRQISQTPYWRGVTKVHELKENGIAVAFASDNCRDPFYGFGDHDGLEVLTQAVRIAHLDTPYKDWCSSVTKTAADLMGLAKLGRIGKGLAADLIIFKARYFSELLSRPQCDRIILRQGKQINTALPEYAELDDLVCLD